MIAANLSRNEDLTWRIYETFENAGDIVQNLIELSLTTDGKYNHVISLLSNLSQLEEIRKYVSLGELIYTTKIPSTSFTDSIFVFRILLESSEGTFQKLLPLIEYKESAIRRNGVVGIIRNLCLSVGESLN